MSTDFRLLIPIRMADLFDGRLEGLACMNTTAKQRRPTANAFQTAETFYGCTVTRKVSLIVFPDTE